jgi:N-methylhydantoinase A
LSSYSLAVDIGGTFTDIVLKADDGRLWVDKTLSTHQDLLQGLFRGVDSVLNKAALQPADVNGVLVHATTTVTNALIERKGVTTALFVTEGFKDVLVIRAEHRYDIYDLQLEFAEPLIPSDLVFGVNERTLASGEVVRDIDPEQVKALAETLRHNNVVSLGICLLNAYKNPQNERRLAELIRQHLPDLYISLSSDIAPQIREYPRASTTAINAYTVPIAQPYLRALALRFEERGFRNHPLIMLSSGGIIGTDVAGRNPVRMIESGPAAGALAATFFAQRLNLSHLMSFDMGGTTAKACLIEGGKPLIAGHFEVDRRYRFKEGSGMPVSVPAIDLIEIGAGGGSIASVDALGLLKVGPRSAGSEPGPACYGRGGEEPTVTDADVVLGLLDPDNFLGGEMKLDRSAAEKAFSRLGSRIGKTAIEVAAGVYRIVAETMAAAARAHATDRGVDHRGIPLLAFGGAGPVHACQVGVLLHSRSVIFPPQASVLSAFGTLVSPPRLDLVRSAIGILRDLDWAEVDRIYYELTTEARNALVAAGCKADEIVYSFGADLRYAGQQHEIGIDLPEDPRAHRDVGQIVGIFEATYLARYGVAPSHVDIEMVNWRLVAQGAAIYVATVSPPRGKAVAPKGTRRVHLWSDAEVPIYDRSALALGQEMAGPALIEERETTIVILPGWQAAIDSVGCVVTTRC